jgi:hypothetical protein
LRISPLVKNKSIAPNFVRRNDVALPSFSFPIPSTQSYSCPCTLPSPHLANGQSASPILLPVDIGGGEQLRNYLGADRSGFFKEL